MPQSTIIHSNGNMIKLILVVLLILWPITSIICGSLLTYTQVVPHLRPTNESLDLQIKVIQKQLRELQDSVNKIADKPESLDLSADSIRNGSGR